MNGYKVHRKDKCASRASQQDINAELLSRLLAYSTAAGVTLALAPDAQGAIVCTATNATLSNVPGTYQINITGSTNAADPTFEISINGTSFYTYQQRKGYDATFKIRRGGKGVAGSNNQAHLFSKSNIISAAAAKWSAGSNTLLLAKQTYKWKWSVTSTYSSYWTWSATAQSTAGNFEGRTAEAKSGFIGVRFNFNGVRHYGWIGFGVTDSHNQAIVSSWAYETEPDMPIPAGVTYRAPLRDAANLTFDHVAANQMALHWVPGDGNRRVVVARDVAAVNWAPVNGTAYAANANFTQAADVGSGNRVVYDGSGETATITGLNPNHHYYFAIFEYGGTSDPATYLYTTGTPATNSQQTLANAAPSVSAGVFFR